MYKIKKDDHALLPRGLVLDGRPQEAAPWMFIPQGYSIWYGCFTEKMNDNSGKFPFINIIIILFP